MKYTPKDIIIKYGKKYVGGYSFKTDKVWYVPQKKLAKRYTAVQANKFIAIHVNRKGEFLAENIKIVKISLEEKLSEKLNN